MWAGMLVAAVLALAVFALTGLIARRVIPDRPMRANHNPRVLHASLAVTDLDRSLASSRHAWRGPTRIHGELQTAIG